MISNDASDRVPQFRPASIPESQTLEVPDSERPENWNYQPSGARKFVFLVPLTTHDRASMFSAMKSESWKKCGTCLRRRPVAEFAISSRRSRDGLANVCMACVRFLKAVRTGQFDEQHAPGGPVDTALSNHGYQWWDYRPRGALARVRVLRGPDGRSVDVSVALAQIEAALGAPAGCWRPAGRRQVCRRSCCTRRHRP